MSISPKTYSRKPFRVNAVQVTKDNLDEVAEWCKGTVEDREVKDGKGVHVKVNVHRPMNERQTKAFVGDWVLESTLGLKVYTQRAFESSFELRSPDNEVGEVPAIQMTMVK